MDLMEGKVTASGKKKNVLNMYENLEGYFDKELLSENGTEDDYTVQFNFSMSMRNFFYSDYFASPSEEYDCEIKAEMVGEDEGFGAGPTLTLIYKSGEIIQGLAFYGLDNI